MKPLSLTKIAAATLSLFTLSVYGQVNPPVTPPGMMTWKYEYDAAGQRTKTIDPNGNVTTHSYDLLGRLRQTVSPQPKPNQSSPVIKTEYDGKDQTLKVTDPRNLVTQYTPDGLGNVTTQVSPDSGTQTFTQDAAGNITSRTDARGKTTTYTYDALNRLTKATYQTGTPTVYEYDGGPTAIPQTPNVVGKLTKISDESGTTTYTYDGFGRVRTKTQTIQPGNNLPSNIQTSTLTYGSYTPATYSSGHLTGITYPSAGRLNLIYGQPGRLTGLSWSPVNPNGTGTNDDPASAIPLLSNIHYTAFGAVKSWSWGNGTPNAPALNDPTRSYLRSYDLHGRMTGYPLGRVGTEQNPIADSTQQGYTRTVGYDNAGRITTYLHLGGPTGNTAQTNTLDQTFAYDGLDRLIWANVGGSPTYGYEYDATGNRTLFNLNGNPYLHTVSPTSNRLSSVQIAGEGNTPITQAVSYDAAGNTISTTSGSPSTSPLSLSYSARGRLAAAQIPNPQNPNLPHTVTYLTNGLEQRVYKSGPTPLIPTGSISYFYDEAGHLLGEYDNKQIPIYETVYLNDTPVAVIKQNRIPNPNTQPQTYTVSTEIFNVYADHLDTPRVITKATDQSIVWSWITAEPFGATPPNQNPNNLGVFTFNQRFPGQVYDAETNLHQNHHREYQALSGNYLTTDPLGLEGGSLSLYSYVNGQPTRYTDPKGLQSPAACALNPANAAACAEAGMLARPVPQAACPPDPDPCDAFKQKVRDAKDHMGRKYKAGEAVCRPGMSRFQLLERANDWLALAQARAQRDQRCFDGGDPNHQTEQATAWKQVSICQQLMR